MYRLLILTGILVLVAGCNQTRTVGGTGGGGYSDSGYGSGYGTKSAPPEVAQSQQTLAAAPGEKPCIPAERAQTLSGLALSIADPLAVTGVAFHPVDGSLLLQTRDQIRLWDPLQGQQRGSIRLRDFTQPIDFGPSATWSGGRISLHVNWLTGSLDIFSNNDGALMGRVWLTPGGWGVVDRSGRFDVDPRHWSHWSWDSGARRFGVSQLADLYYEPALLGKLAVGAELNTADAPPLAEGILPPPAVELALNEFSTDITGSVSVRDRGGCVGAVRLFHNGKGVPLQPPTERAAAGETEIWRFSLPRQAGENRLRALATSTQKVESAPVSASVPGPQVQQYRPRAHVLIIGVDEYVNPALRLDFAVADGRGMANWARELRSGQGTLFDGVSITEVYDRQATRERIREELSRLQRVDPRDTVLVYLAGHGENDGVKWYFLPTEFGRSLSFEAIAAEGFSSTELRDALLNIPARRLALVVDACKSGDMRQVFSAAVDGRYLEWVSRTAGIQLLAATDQEQLAVELPELGHGALTYTLLRGLAGEADAVPADRTIMVQELFGYSEVQLPDITRRIAGEAQIPMLFEYGADFPLHTLGGR